MLKKNQKYSLLYVEDEPIIREMVILYLSDYFDVIYQATNGEEALNIFEDKNPDIIISDIKMPKMNGLEFSKKIRTLSNTPIIITTAYTTTEYLLEAIELNLIKYLIKPIEEEKLKKALKLCFNYLERENALVIDLTSQHTYDALNHTLITNKSEITSLTITQTKFLDLLIKHKNRAVSYEEIENHIWYEKGMSEAALRCLIYDLRQMTHKNVIKNVSKIGYRVQLHG